MEIENRDLSRLYHMLQYCMRIQTVLGKFDNPAVDFFALENYVQRDAICFYLFQIGELARSVKDEFKEKHPELPWRPMRGLRNIVAHEYGEVDFEVIWETIDGDLPDLVNQISNILQAEISDFDILFKEEKGLSPESHQ